MRARLGGIAAAMGLLFMMSAGPASAVSFDFESEPVVTTQDGSLTSLTMTVDGLTVVITRSSGASFDVLDATAGGFPDAYPDTWGDQALSPSANKTLDDFFIATFSESVVFFSLESGDFGRDADDIFLEAFSGVDGTGASLGMDSTTWNGDFGLNPGDPSDPPAVLAVGSEEGFRSVTFYGRGPDAEFLFTTYFDNFTATTVPEPSTALLLGLGLVGIAVGRRRAN